MGDGITSDNTLTLTGTAAANSTVRVYDGSTLLGTATANGSGAWSYTTDTLADATHNFMARATDAAGNTSMASSILQITVDSDAAEPNPVSGFPNAANTGIPDGVTLTASGDVNVTTAGAVINALDVKGTIWVMAPNVTIQNCKITSTDWTSIWIKPGITGTIVKDCEISNVGSSPDGANGIVGAGTFLRNDIHDVENGFNISGPSTIQDNYVHDMNAPNVRAGTQWGGPHYDGIEINGGVSNVTIKHNTIINENGQTSAVMINNDFGPVSNITVDGNYLAGGGYTLYSDGSFSSTDRISGVQFTNNVLGEGYWGYYYFKGNSPTLTGNDEIGQDMADSRPIRRRRLRPTGDAETPRHAAAMMSLTGTAGADTLKGLAGNDTYTVNHTGDKVVELANQGTDKVESTISHTLAANVENLQLIGTGDHQRHRQRARKHDHRQRRRQHHQGRRRQRHAQRLGRKGHLLRRERQRHLPVQLAVQRQWRQGDGLRARRRQARLQQDRRQYLPKSATRPSSSMATTTAAATVTCGRSRTRLPVLPTSTERQEVFSFKSICRAST